MTKEEMKKAIIENDERFRDKVLAGNLTKAEGKRFLKVLEELGITE